MNLVDAPTQPAGPASADSPSRGPVARIWGATNTIFLARTADAPKRTWAAPVLGFVALLAGAAVSLFRQPGAGALNTVWAEDGSVFLSDAASKGTLEAITTPYAGYYHLMPRLLAEVTTLFPAEAAAAVMAILAALVTSAMAVLVYVASGPHLRHPVARFLAAAMVIVTPLGQQELGNSLANLHWPGLYLVFWMLIWSPRGRAGRIVAVAAVFAVAASDILVLVYLPLALLRALRRRTGETRREAYGLVLAGALALGLAIQVYGLVGGGSDRPLSPDPVAAVTGYVLRAVPPALLGERWNGQDVSLPLAALAWLIVAAVVVIAWRRLTNPQWTFAVIVILHSAALYALPVVLSGLSTPRYAAAPAMLLVCGLAALLLPGTGTTKAKLPIAGLALLLAVVCAVNLRVDNRRADGPLWNAELTAAQQACAAGTTEVAIPIAPVETPPWTAKLTCAYLTS